MAQLSEEESKIKPFSGKQLDRENQKDLDETDASQKRDCCGKGVLFRCLEEQNIHQSNSDGDVRQWIKSKHVTG